MSYQVTASERLSDEQWLELTSLASKYGFSAPQPLITYCNRTATQLVQTSTHRITELFENAQNCINKPDCQTR